MDDSNNPPQPNPANNQPQPFNPQVFPPAAENRVIPPAGIMPSYTPTPNPDLQIGGDVAYTPSPPYIAPAGPYAESSPSPIPIVMPLIPASFQAPVKARKRIRIWRILLVFVLLAIIFLLPILPGRALFPKTVTNGQNTANSAESSCQGTAVPIVTTGPYENKTGFPLTYFYRQNVTSTVQCDNTSKQLSDKQVSTIYATGLVVDIMTAIGLTALLFAALKLRH